MTVQCQSSRVRPLWPGAGFTPEAPRSQGRSLVRAKALVSVGPATPGGTEPPLSFSVRVPWSGVTSLPLGLQLRPASHFEP